MGTSFHHSTGFLCQLLVTVSAACKFRSALDLGGVAISWQTAAALKNQGPTSNTAEVLDAGIPTVNIPGSKAAEFGIHLFCAAGGSYMIPTQALESVMPAQALHPQRKTSHILTVTTKSLSIGLLTLLAATRIRTNQLFVPPSEIVREEVQFSENTPSNVFSC